MTEQKAREKAERSDERQEDFLWQPFTLGAQQCTAQNMQHCFSFQIAFPDNPFSTGNHISQWVSVLNVGIVNCKLQKPDINLALLGLFSQ